MLSITRLGPPPARGIASSKDSFPNQDAFSGEVQHLVTSHYLNVVNGFGQFNIRSNNDFVFNFIPPPSFEGTTNINTQHTNLYSYSYLKPFQQLTITGGASWDLLHDRNSAGESKSQVNPKVGVIWNALPGTIVRLAAFRTLKRTLLTDQTLEPTQVAGFNQFYDGINSTSSWLYGGAINQTFTRNVFGGVEVSKRDMTIPVTDITGTVTSLAQGRSTGYIGRSYLFVTPHDWVSLGVEYQYEKLKVHDSSSLGNNTLVNSLFFQEVETHRAPLGLKLFHPSGLSASLRGSWVYQKGDFQQRGVGTLEAGQDHFWIVDAGLSYRLPNRYGLLTVGAAICSTSIFNIRTRTLIIR